MNTLSTSIQWGSASAGIKPNNQTDCLLIQLPDKTLTSALFTQNQYCSAPVVVSKRHLACTAETKYLLINSGNANCGLGDQGEQVALDGAVYVAEQLQCAPEQVLVFSTGVINEVLPLKLLKRGIDLCIPVLNSSDLVSAAEAIMTTDKKPKWTEHQTDDFIIRGIAKGSGMICPNMATMLGFVFSDVSMPLSLLNSALKQAVDRSFNRITVDGDTSTNDAVTLSITGEGIHIESEKSPFWTPWFEGLVSVCRTLANKIIEDAEGGTKVVTIKVEQAGSQEEALDAAYTIAHSPLVKTAFYAQDANLGRIAAALGRSNVPNLDFKRVQMYLDAVCIMENGALPTDYDEVAATDVLKKPTFELRIVLGRGTANEQVLTADLSHEYVTINAEYRS